MGKHKDKSKKYRKKHKKSKQEYSSNSSSSSEEEWVEKPKQSDHAEEEHAVKSSSPSDIQTKTTESQNRDEWMSLPSNFLTTSNRDRRREREESKKQERERQQYNPRESVRELNPYWKDNGDGLPSVSKFKKPSDDTDDYKDRGAYRSSSSRSSNWKKSDKQVKTNSDNSQTEIITATNVVEEKCKVSIMTEKELNVLAAKLVKAEIMGNTKLILELKDKLEQARKLHSETKPAQNDQEVLLTRTDSKGYSRPVKMQSDYGEASGSRRKKQKVETHTDGQRVRYFADDDKYSLKQMFENEKFSSVEDQNAEFMKLAGRIAKKDDLDDVFADKIRHKESDEKVDRRNADKAISEHQRTTESLDNCTLCLQSSNMLKHLMVSMGETFYLSIPPQEPLTEGHCLLIPIRHVPCATQLDENEWSELLDFRKALTKMFISSDEDVIFFETVMYLNRYPHMSIHCVPLPREEGDLAPIYFKKAIDESETEWASNKKLVSLKGRDVRRAVPKGLPYFSVSFGMEEGYAHVIEDQKLFPANFAEEIIGGMLDLHHSKWRKPKKQSFDEQSKRMLDFSKKWSKFDINAQQ